MFTFESLNNLSMEELEKIALENNILNIEEITAKNDLIILILKITKLKEIELEKQKDLHINYSSNMLNKASEEKKDYYIDRFSDFIPDLPDSYNKDKLILMVRDPFWGFVYWDLSSDLINAHNLNDVERVLRVYDVTDMYKLSYFDIKISSFASNWYVEFPKSNSSYVIEFGYIKDNQFIKLLRSNVARTPRSEMSDQLDEEWMSSDENYLKILEASGIDKLFEQMGSQELIKFLSSDSDKSPVMSQFFASSSSLNVNSSRNFNK